MFIIWQKQEQFNPFNVTDLYYLTFRFRTAKNWISFFQILLVLFTFFLSSAFCHLQKLILLDENSQWFCILVCNLFTSKHLRSRCQSRWENLDLGQYPFQPIKFVDLVVPSPCETKPYNNIFYSTRKIIDTVADRQLSSILTYVMTEERKGFLLFSHWQSRYKSSKLVSCVTASVYFDGYPCSHSAAFSTI